jgi:hypothetical protein
MLDFNVILATLLLNFPFLHNLAWSYILLGMHDICKKKNVKYEFDFSPSQIAHHVMFYSENTLCPVACLVLLAGAFII